MKLKLIAVVGLMLLASAPTSAAVVDDHCYPGPVPALLTLERPCATATLTIAVSGCEKPEGCRVDYLLFAETTHLNACAKGIRTSQHQTSWACGPAGATVTQPATEYVTPGTVLRGTVTACAGISGGVLPVASSCGTGKQYSVPTSSLITPDPLGDPDQIPERVIADLTSIAGSIIYTVEDVHW